MVAIHQVNAATVIQAGTAVTFIYLVAADSSHVPRVADAGIGINAILTLAMVAGIRITIVNVFLTQHTSEARGALTFIAIWVIDAFSPVQTRSTGAVINIDLANWPCETRWTQTLEAVDLVYTLPVVHTRVALTFIDFQFTMHTVKTWHAKTCKASNLIQTRGIILARVRMALIDVCITPRPCIALQTRTVERAICVHTLSGMLTRIAVGHGTFIHILCTISPFVALGTGANILSIQRVGVTECPLVARIADARIIQMT